MSDDPGEHSYIYFNPPLVANQATERLIAEKHSRATYLLVNDIDDSILAICFGENITRLEELISRDYPDTPWDTCSFKNGPALVDRIALFVDRVMSEREPG